LRRLPLIRTLITRVHTLRSVAEGSTSTFDNGCGTGILTLALKDRFSQRPILATDASSSTNDILNARVENAGYDIATRVLDARDLAGLGDNMFTHIFSTFMVCLAPDPDQIAQEIYRVMKLGGVLGLAIWADTYFGYFNTPRTRAC